MGVSVGRAQVPALPGRHPRSPSPGPRRPPAPSRSVFELAEAEGERFDEACQDAVQREEHSQLVLGPSVPVPMRRLRAGALAWFRPLSDTRGRADLYYTLEPGNPRTDGGAAELPVEDLASENIALDIPCRGPPAARLIGVVASKSAPKGFRAFVETVRSILESDAD